MMKYFINSLEINYKLKFCIGRKVSFIVCMYGVIVRNRLNFDFEKDQNSSFYLEQFSSFIGKIKTSFDHFLRIIFTFISFKIIPRIHYLTCVYVGIEKINSNLIDIYFDKFEDRIKHLRNIYGSSDNKFIINYY